MFDPEAPPELQVTRWFNTHDPLTLAGLKGRVVVLVAFQMLCPGCVSHGLPQARRLYEQLSETEVAVVGLHTVFEHHPVMTPEALEAFIHEYKWTFPIGVDTPGADEGLPKTMAAFEMRGTPSILLFDRQGRLRRHYLGQVEDIRLAAEVMAYVIEDATAPRETSVAIERRLQSTLADPGGHQHHEHGPDCNHGHEHEHGHGGHGHR